MNFFITGTDTDCGKTYVTALLVRAAREAGIDAVGAKPVCCGPRGDVEILSAAAGGIEPLDALNPVWFETPAAPMACELSGENPGDYESAAKTMRSLARRHECVLCEGVGGWLVPLRRGLSMADFAADLGWPVIIVARNRLGVLNHTMLTIESVKAKGLTIAGLVLNMGGEANSRVEQTNRVILEEIAGVPLLAEVAWGQTSIGWPSFPASLKKE